MVTRTLKNVYTIGSDVTVNSGDFGNGTFSLSITFNAAPSQLDIEDNTAALDNDVKTSEKSDDPSQFITGTSTPIFIEDELVFKDSSGNTYTFYSLDTGSGATNTDGAYLFFKSSSTGELPPTGVTLTYVSELGNTIHTYPCFLGGTLIETVGGAVAVEDLSCGDLVWTVDHGLQPIRWIGSRQLSADDLHANSNLRPIRIKRNALGANTPFADLLISPQHRVLIQSKICQRIFEMKEVLVAAKHLTMIDGIEIASDVSDVVYFHLLFDQHEVVVSNGAATESLFTGPEALKSISYAAQEEIFALFPKLRDLKSSPLPARHLSSGKMGQKLATRHARNRRPLVIQPVLLH